MGLVCNKVRFNVPNTSWGKYLTMDGARYSKYGDEIEEGDSLNEINTPYARFRTSDLHFSISFKRGLIKRYK